jgi:hypothetical protein
MFKTLKNIIMKKILLYSLCFLGLTGILSGQKVPLDHSVYDGWRSLSAAAISDDGKWVTYEINPQQGDGWLYIVNTATGTTDSVFCGTRATFSPDCKYLVYQVKPTYAQTRKA